MCTKLENIEYLDRSIDVHIFLTFFNEYIEIPNLS